jgi:hypothetical protein
VQGLMQIFDEMDEESQSLLLFFPGRFWLRQNQLEIPDLADDAPARLAELGIVAGPR